MSNKTINQFSTDTNLNGGEFILIMTNNVTKNMLLSDVKTFILKDTQELYITGGTANNLNRTYTFTNNTGGTFTVIALSDILITGATTNDLNRTYTFTNSTGGTFTVNGLLDVYVTGGTYSNGTTTFTNSTGGTFNVTGFSTNNISDSLYSVYAGLNANVTSSATTSILSYGVNVFTGVTSTNYATKLPQPVTGKSVKVINNGSTLLVIHPSNAGGKINDLPINATVSIPPDGKIYEFICIVNPLPGEWTFSAPATAQFDSGEITITVTGGTGPSNNKIVAAYDSSRVGLRSDFTNSSWFYNGKNRPSIISGNDANGYIVAFKPTTPWLGISKIKVYTNIVYDETDSAASVRMLASGGISYYDLSTGALITNGSSNTNATLFNFGLDNYIQDFSGGSPTYTGYTTNNIGDEGSCWGEKVANTDIYSDVSLGNGFGTLIGTKDNGTVTYPYGGPYSGQEVNSSYTSYISFQISPKPFVAYGTLTDFKFRFIIEYF